MAAKKQEARTSRLVWVLAALCICAAAALVVLLAVPVPKGELPAEAETEAPTVSVVLPVAADNDPGSLRCRSGYTEDSFDPDTPVARLGDAVLTAGELQAIYYLEVCGYDGELRPDLSRPLEEQLCLLTDEDLSWQHYFLRRALDDWALWQGLVLVSQEPIPVTEEAFQPSEADHEAYFPDGIPAEAVLYADRDCYTPSTAHQEYLDSLPETLLSLAREQGAEGIGELAGTRDEDVIQAARLMNLAYMFLTESTWEEAKAAAAEGGTVSIRHCLLTPEGGVSAEETAWTNCGAKARQLLQAWSGNWLTVRNSDANFARLANENSQDAATAPDGGLLTGIRQGQLIAPLDAWCFDEARQPGDTEVIRSDLGWHIVYFQGAVTAEETEAARLAFTEAVDALLDRAAEYGSPEVDYSAVALAPITQTSISTQNLLYADVGFERFSEVPLYLQQDYGELRFGQYSMAVGGCGVTSLAMIATYMTDTVYTPAMMAEQYKLYAGAGTDGTVFLHAPAELGFYADTQLYNWDEVVSHLQEIGPVVTLQIHGVFTSNGHYMVLSRLNEDGTVVVRDSNLKNYSRLTGFQTDSFTKADVLSGAQLFYTFQKKNVTLPGCTRCGGGNETAQDYLCPKCAAALLRRNAFLELMAEA